MLRFCIQFSVLAVLLSGRVYAANYTCEILQPIVWAINNRGQAVGIDINGAFLREPDGKVTNIGGSDIAPTGINDKGQVSGLRSGGFGKGFIRDLDGTYTFFEGANGSLISGVGGINNHGDVAGKSRSPEPDYFFIRSASGTYTTFPNAPGYSQGDLIGINDSQVVTEYQVVAFEREHGFITSGVRYPDGTFLPIPYGGLPDQADPAHKMKRTSLTGISNSGSVTGYVELGPASPFQKTYSFVHDLNTTHFPAVVCPGHVGETVMMLAEGINDQGVVAGAIMPPVQNVGYGFIATPTGRNGETRLSNTSWTFSGHPPGESSGLGTIYLTNTGNAPLNILHLELTGADFDQFSLINHCPLVLGINHTCNFQLMFNPTRSGPARTQLMIVDDAPDGPQIIPISGTAQGPAPRLSQTDWAFGSHAIAETSGPGTVYVYNQGTSAVHFSSIRITGTAALDFKITANTCGSSLAPYKACGVTFHFTPTAAGNRLASLVFTDDAVPAQQTVLLYGGGHAP